ncbi:MAG: hypothetical protein ACTHMD_16525 [Flavisolibacter sp.]
MQEETKTHDKQAEDYISLSTIKNAILDFFGFLFRGVELISLSIRKNLFLFFVCCLLGIAASYLFYVFRPKFYTSEMTVYYNDLTRKDYSEIVSNLNTLAITQSYADLQKELGVNAEVVKNIKGLQALKMNGETLDKDTSSKIGQPFKIQFKLNQIMATEPLQNALLNYLNNNPYLKLIKEGQKKVYQDKLAFIEREQQKLDSLKTSYNNAIASSKMSATFYNNAMNPADLYVQSNSLANQKEFIVKWMNNESNAVMLIDGLKKPVSANTFALKGLLIVGLACGVALGIIACILAAITKEVQGRRRLPSN